MNITIISDSLYTKKGSPTRAMAKAMLQKGHEVRVILPFYEKEYIETDLKFSMLGSYFVKMPVGNFSITLYCSRIDDITCLFIANNKLFSRQKCWGYHDDALRSAVFCLAALESMAFTNSYPEYIFTDSANTALVSVYLKFKYHLISKQKNIKCYHYINSNQYGIYDKSTATSILGIPKEETHILICKNEVNLTKAAIICSTRVFVGENAVSLLYSHDSDIHHTAVQFGFKIRKLRMGIDYSYFSPDLDSDIHKPFTSAKTDGKLENKLFVQKCLYMEEDENIPLVTLYCGKGTEQFNRIIRDIIKCDIQLILISGSTRASDITTEHKRIVYINDNSAETLKNVFSASDFAIFGSLECPSGNPAFIASAYGCVPIIPSHRFFDFGISYFNKLTLDGNGYTYDQNISRDMIYTLWDALGIYRHDKRSYNKLLQNTMKKTFSAADSVETIEKEAEKAVYSLI